MTSIVIPCPRCGHHLHLPNRDFLGRKGRCPDCQLKFIMEESLVIDEAEAQRIVDERRRAEEQRAAQAERDAREKRAAEEHRLAEQKRREDEERRQIEEQRREDEQRREEEARQQQEQKRQRQLDAAARLADTRATGEPASAGETVEPDPALAVTHKNEPSSGDADLSVDIDTVDYDESAAAAIAAMVEGDEDIPEQFGRYRVLEQIGQGSMGAVYLAHDSELDRQVAIKIPRFSELEEPESRERFYREARAAATLRHPNICQVFDIGEIEGRHFIAMEYIKGNPLSTFIKQPKPQPVRKIAATLRKLAKALQVAHDKGLVHRDLKPDNIMIDERGEPIIMDFGLVRLIGDDDRLTTSGAIVGSPAYMSPEQISGEAGDVGPASDIFSLGVITYELLTRRRPFRGSLSIIFEQILSAEPLAPSKLRPDVDAVFESICLTMMAKKPSGRYASMSKVADAVNVYLKDSGTSSTLNEGAAALPASTSATTQPAATTPDEEAARWVLSIGGSLKISTAETKSVAVPDLDSLPDAPFRVVDVGLLKNASVDDEGLKHLRGADGLLVLRLSETNVTDEGLACLSGLTGLPVLDLSYTKVTDAGLKQLKGMKGLKQLDLANTAVTDAGLAHIKRLSGLQFLGLYATNVTDSGLKSLSGLKNLQFLGLYGTRVTDAGVAKLKKSLRNCTVSR